MDDQIKIVFTDVDGVWTDGKLHYSENGIVFRSFSVLDGQGASMLMKSGIVLVVLTGEDTPDIKKRFNDLKVKYLYTKLRNKLYIAEEVLKKLNLSFSDAAFIGDDLSDLPLIREVAHSAAPHGVSTDISKEVTWKLTRRGGEGAFREFAEMILKYNKVWDDYLENYMQRISKRMEG
jgi:3-deoxy-D-manno-octulosonate 8-phosphate phosphatase (KDO 8-P phosphatase)